MDARERQARLELVALSAGRDRRRQAGGGRGRGARGQRGGCWPTPSVSKGCARSPTPSSTTTTRRRSRSLAECLEEGRGAGGARPAFAPYLEPATAVKAQLEDLASFLRAYADGVDASPARLQEVEDRLAQLERLKRKYGPGAGRGDREGARLAARTGLLLGPGEASRRPRARARGGDRRLPGRGRASCRRRGDGVARFARGSSKRSWPTWRWPSTRFDVRFESNEPRPTIAGPSGASIGGVLRVAATPARTRDRSRVSPRAASCRASCSRCGRRVARPSGRSAGSAGPEDAHLRRGGRRHRRARGRGGRGAPARARRPVPGAVHHAPGADRRAGDDAVRGREAGAGGTDRDSRSPRSTEDQRVEELSRMIAGSRASDATRGQRMLASC